MNVRTVLQTAAVVVAAMLLGCGSGTNITSGSGLQGSYGGIYRIVDGAYVEQGTLTLVIGKDGRLAGTGLDNATAAASNLTGWVADSGRFNGSLITPAGTYTLTGSLTHTPGTQNLVGVLDRRDASTGTAAGTYTIDCLLQ